MFVNAYLRNYQLDFDHFFCYTFNLITEQFYEIGLVKFSRYILISTR